MIGWIVLAVVMFIPFIGWAITTVVLCLGYGSIFYALRGGWDAVTGGPAETIPA